MARGDEYCRRIGLESKFILPFLPLLLGFILSAIIAVLAYQRGSLAPSGVIGAMLVGTIIFASGGWTWALLLIVFFISSSAFSHYRAHMKEPLAEKFQKGHRRDLGQVLANGGWGALIALAFALTAQPVLFVAFVGAMATVTADTWATELGVLSARPPRLITNGRVVPVGTSGAITPLGTLAALAGALFIGMVASLEALWYGVANALLGLPFIDLSMFLALWTSRAVALVPPAVVGGLAGALFDSLLGATVQAIYFCDFDQKETESARHRCGRDTRLIRGWRWLDNDGVNFLASVFGSIVAAGMYRAIR